MIIKTHEFNLVDFTVHRVEELDGGRVQVSRIVYLHGEGAEEMVLYGPEILAIGVDKIQRILEENGRILR